MAVKHLTMAESHNAHVAHEKRQMESDRPSHLHPENHPFQGKPATDQTHEGASGFHADRADIAPEDKERSNTDEARETQAMDEESGED